MSSFAQEVWGIFNTMEHTCNNTNPTTFRARVCDSDRNVHRSKWSLGWRLGRVEGHPPGHEGGLQLLVGDPPKPPGGVSVA